MTNTQHLNLLLSHIAKNTGDAITREEAKLNGHERYLCIDESGQFGGYRIVSVGVNNGAHYPAFGFSDTADRLKYKEMKLRLEGILAGLPIIPDINTKRLFDNTLIPSMVSINERIFQIETYDGETILCNIGTAKMLINKDLCKRIKHYWNNKFTTIGKLEVKEMPL